MISVHVIDPEMSVCHTNTAIYLAIYMDLLPSGWNLFYV